MNSKRALSVTIVTTLLVLLTACSSNETRPETTPTPTSTPTSSSSQGEETPEAEKLDFKVSTDSATITLSGEFTVGEEQDTWTNGDTVVFFKSTSNSTDPLNSQIVQAALAFSPTISKDTVSYPRSVPDSIDARGIDLVGEDGSYGEGIITKDESGNVNILLIKSTSKEDFKFEQSKLILQSFTID